MSSVPQFRELTETECEELLASQHVGRLAYSFRDRVDIAPVHYVLREGWIYGRTRMGNKVDIMSHHPWVAFEVDEIHSMFDARSVVVRGRLEILDPHGPQSERERYAAGVAAVRELVPGAFLPADPTPGLDLVFRLPVDEVTGRAVSSG